VVGLFAIGGPIFVNRVEDDLENRAVEVLNEAGVGPVDVHFSGQDGELRCIESGPVDIPDEVVAAIANLRGVSSIEVDGTCLDSAGAEPPTNDDSAEQDSGVETPPTEVPLDDSTDDTTTEADGTTTVPDLDLLTDVISSDSQFSTLAGLLGDADLTEVLSDDGPFSVFAPTNAAFEALGPDLAAALARDLDLLATVLSHHVTAGTKLSTDLEAGDLEMLDGTTVTVNLSDGVVITSGESIATVTEADLIASNGVVHAIDQVLLPVGTVIGGDPAGTLAGAEFVDGQIVLSGAVTSEEQRTALLAAASDTINTSNVIDELVVDSATALSNENSDALGAVIAAMAPNLVSGTAEIVDAAILVSGTFATEADRTAFEAAMALVESAAITVELVERPVADAGAAATVEIDLNQLVTDNPILFDSSSTTIKAESLATIDRVAAVAKRVGGITIVIQGHTDTDGLAQSNQALSEGRARSVREALIARGIVDDTLTTVGLGGTEPILGANGVENKTASRRVEFVVSPP
jgi:outer membrane protein OmpA-like peptidoglycan-associated protein/uncharacterized surface protein with fasciclin (FAS1) repeats